MVFKHYPMWLMCRAVLLVTTLVLLASSLVVRGYHATSVILALVGLLQIIELLRYINKTNHELKRFIDAVNYADFSQRFEYAELGAGFDELGATFKALLDRLQAARVEQEQSLRHLSAVIEHVPIPLISISAEHKVRHLNASARRLFGSHTVVNVDDLASFNPQLPGKLLALAVGERCLMQVAIDDEPKQLSIAVTEVNVAGHLERLVSLQDIQVELGTAQIDAWQELVKVLTHEIMNSITPLASLAKTAEELVDDVKSNVSVDCTEDMDDIAQAVGTVARRSNSLMQFVGNYRKLTHIPKPQKQSFVVSQWLDEVMLIMSQNWQSMSIQYSTSVQPDTLTLTADKDMVTQVLINLLQNAAQALIGQSQPTLTVKAYVNVRGRLMIEVADNGMGIADDVADKIFIPFFTTKREGSGVGLALTRQIMLAHGGNVRMTTEPGKGSCFTLTF